MKRLVVNFSGRRNGNCENVSKVIQEMFNMDEVEIISFNNINIQPCTNCDYECFDNKENCPYYNDEIKNIYHKILESDFVYYIIPNYCGYPCANFFIFNERSVCVFSKEKELLDKYLQKSKKFIVISSSNQDNFKNVLQYQTIMAPDILFLNAREYNQRSIEGKLMDNEDAKNKVIQFLSYMYS